MGWRFRKSFSPFPGVRLTFSKRGISTSVGLGPIRLTAGPRGASVTTRIPGTGLSFQQSLPGSRQSSGATAPRSPAPQSVPVPSPAPIPIPIPAPPIVTPVSGQLPAIESSNSEALTTSGLEEFKKLLEQAHRQFSELTIALGQARTLEATSIAKVESWHRGWFLRRIFKSTFRRMCQRAEEVSAERVELEEQVNLSRLPTECAVPAAMSEAFRGLCDAFARMSGAQRVWDTVGARRANKTAERTTASRVVERKRVAFQLGRCELIDSEYVVPHLENANGGDLFFYPAFILYFTSKDQFALLEYAQVELSYRPTKFIEEEAVPTDSRTVGQTWAKANKDGSPDRRFKGNYQIPVVEYGQFTFRSATGMQEEYMVSDVELSTQFAKAWKNFVGAMAEAE